jgi:glycosyltransferase involved in cell wall biosynthesis
VSSDLFCKARISFSIVITCHNQRTFIGETVQSALSQTYLTTEIIVVDDASTDGSPAVLKPFENVIKVVPRHNSSGASAARNLGASLAKGDYLVFLDGDDVLLPWALELYARLVRLREPVLILGNLLYFDGPTPNVNYAAVPNEIVIVEYDCLMNKDRQYRACASTIVVERNAFEAVRGWTEAIFPAEDYDLLLKLGYSGRTIQINSPATVCYRMHTGNIMRQVPQCVSMVCKVIDRARLGVYGSGAFDRFDSYSFLGGPVYFWLNRALRTQCYSAAFRLLFRGLPFILIGAMRRLTVTITGKCPIEVLPGIRDSGEGGDKYEPARSAHQEAVRLCPTKKIPRRE